MPAVSIILPTFNRLRFLAPAVGSVLAQTFEDWELLIADDGSDQETRAYLRALRDRRIKVLWLAHTGKPAVVRNAALREAAGSYIAFLDSDDLWVSEKLEIQLTALRSQQRRRWSYSAYTRIDAGGRARRYPGSKPWIAFEGAIFERILRYEADIVTATVMAERQLLASLGGFAETLAMQEDYDLWMRLALVSDAIVIEQPLVGMRSHDQHYGKGGLDARLSRQTSLANLRQRVGDPRWLKALAQAETENTLQLALAYAGIDRRAAVRMLRSTCRVILRSPQLWPLFTRVILKFLAPRWVLRLRQQRAL